jgi:Ribosome-associated heat shock protein implicated in the recycling of the 50S subunit (S4 paralog)
MEEVRIDKYLWAVRLYKTRSLASEACKEGKVLFNGQAIKPSKEVKEGDEIELVIDQLHKKIKVIALLTNRVGAKEVLKYMQDLTPQQEYQRIEDARHFAFEKRDRGLGRPTKKERRSIEVFKGGK